LLISSGLNCLKRQNFLDYGDIVDEFHGEEIKIVQV
jgi:hypothetical protein